MTRKFVDLSIYLENDVLSDPPAFAPKIQYFTHENTFAQIEPFFPGLKKQDLPDGEGWAVEMISLSTHNGTHLDAPYHFHSTMDKALGQKKPAIAIDEVPLEWCFQPGVKLDFRRFADGYVVSAADVEAELARIGHTLSPLEIVVVNTRAGARYGLPTTCQLGLRHGLRSDDVPARARRAPDRHRRLELGCAVRAHREEVRRDPRRVADLGRPQGRPRHRLLPPREAAQPGSAAAVGLLHLAAFRTRSAAHRRAGRARWRSSTTR